VPAPNDHFVWLPTLLAWWLRSRHKQNAKPLNWRLDTWKRLKLEAETKQHITEIQAERDETIASVRALAQRKIEEVKQQKDEAIAQAQALTTTAQGEAGEASARENLAETSARAQIATSERLVVEVRTTLDRERAEVDRLRAELAATVIEARTRAESERAECHATLDRERAEVDRLRAELATARMQAEQATRRADQFATLADELRSQLAQERLTEKG
jgi:hypothetical protein